MKRKLSFVALLFGLSLTGCSADLSAVANYAVLKVWTTPALKLAVEGTAEAAIKSIIKGSVVGKELEVPGPNCLVEGVEWVELDLGATPPTLKVWGETVTWETSTHYYIQSNWHVVWPKGTKTKLDFRLALTGASWWMPGYPDHTFHVRDIDMSAGGQFLVQISKTSPYEVKLSRVLRYANTNMKCSAEGWFWTIDVTKMFKEMTQKVFLDKIVGKSIENIFKWSF